MAVAQASQVLLQCWATRLRALPCLQEVQAVWA